MTWVVGRAVRFGYSAGISDIRVTCGRTERDCLQKIYPVGRFMALGFSGSVRIGFSMVDRLTELLRADDPETAWVPQAVAEWWPADAREVFSCALPRAKQCGCSLMLLSAHPTENAGDAPWARCYVHRFRAPDFMAEQATGDEVVSIGSGAGVAPYREALQAAGNDLTHLQMEVGNPGGTAHGLMTVVRAALECNPRPGISRHLQVCIVRRGGIDIHHYNRKSFGGVAGDPVMPPLIRSFKELEEPLRATGSDAEEAQC